MNPHQIQSNDFLSSLQSNIVLTLWTDFFSCFFFVKWKQIENTRKKQQRSELKTTSKVMLVLKFDDLLLSVISLSYYHICVVFFSFSSLLIATCVHHRPIFNCWWDIRYNSSSFIAWEMCNLTFFQKPFHAYYFRYLLRWNESVKLLVESSVWTYGSKYAMR